MEENGKGVVHYLLRMIQYNGLSVLLASIGMPFISVFCCYDVGTVSSRAGQDPQDFSRNRWDHRLQYHLVPAPSETCWFRGMSVGGSFRRV